MSDFESRLVFQSLKMSNQRSLDYAKDILSIWYIIWKWWPFFCVIYLFFNKTKIDLLDSSICDHLHLIRKKNSGLSFGPILWTNRMSVVVKEAMKSLKSLFSWDRISYPFLETKSSLGKVILNHLRTWSTWPIVSFL